MGHDAAVALLQRRRAPGPDQGRTLLVHLNARMQPLHRGDVFEDPLDEHLRTLGLAASVTGGGTQLTVDGEPESCHIELELRSEATRQVVEAVTDFLDARRAPRGSYVEDLDGHRLADFGVVDGLALYLNGTDLPPEVYASSDVNELIDSLLDALRGTAGLLSYWEGPRDTALYLYGPDLEAIQALLEPFLASRADTQLSRLERIT